ncbi:hypothetical protein AB9K35_07700 [Leisingera sp. XS_AS12]|uniref:hypothetical protein n=1 Tax=Leisingera sp. XS_AS12 TaxID=3241294 RepID=UPI003513B03D
MPVNLEINTRQPKRKRLAYTEVRGLNDALQLVHHATREHGFAAADIAPLSHFGTRTAAKARIFEQEGARMFSAHLDIRNPLHLNDMHGNHDVPSLLNLIAYSSADGAVAARRGEILAADAVGEGEEMLARTLLDVGWDGIAYTNNHEDPGSRSWIILDPAQVMLVSEGPVSQSLDPWELDAAEFVGPASILPHFAIDAGEEAYASLWDMLDECGDDMPVLARDQDGWEARWIDNWGLAANIGLFDGCGVARGFYLGGESWIDEDARGAGRSSLMINAAADLLGGSPTQALLGNGFSPAGYAAHLSAHRKICDWARDQGYVPAVDLSAKKGDWAPVMP